MNARFPQQDVQDTARGRKRSAMDPVTEARPRSECSVCDPLVTWCAHFGDQVVLAVSPEARAALRAPLEFVWEVSNAASYCDCPQRSPTMMKPHLDHAGLYQFHDTEAEARADFDRRAAIMREGDACRR